MGQPALGRTERAAVIAQVLRVTAAVLFCVGWVATARAQSAQFRRLGPADGLPNSLVTDMVQDRIGYMWFGTASGLARYDGLSMRVYRYAQSNPGSILNNRVNAVYADRRGDVWVGTIAVSRYDRARDEFVHYMLPDSTHPHRYISGILEDSRGGFWVGANDGVYLLDRATGKAQTVNVPWPTGTPRQLHRVLLEDRGGGIWINGQLGGLARLDPATGAYRFYARGGRPAESLPDNFVRVMVEDPAGRIWLGTASAGVAVLDPTTNRVQRIGPAPRNGFDRQDIRALLVDGKRGIWIGTGSGLGYLEAAMDRPGTLDNHEYRPAGYTDGPVYALARDASGILWVGTFADGVLTSAGGGDAIRSFTFNPGNHTGLGFPSVLGFSEAPDGKVWIATGMGGVDLLDRSTGRISHFNRAGKPLNVLAVAADRDGKVWLGTWKDGVQRFDPRSGEYATYPINDSGARDNSVFSVHVDRAGTVWAGTWQDGLLRLDVQHGSVTRYRIAPPGHGQSQIWRIRELSDGRLALATLENGLVLFDPRTGSQRSYWAERGSPQALSSDEVRAVLESEPGVLWIGTAGGLDRLDLRTHAVSHFTEANGLPSSVIAGLESDLSGQLWISSSNGIARFDVRSGGLRHFTAADGLVGRDFAPRASLRLQDGSLLFAGNTGFNLIDPGRLLSNPRPPAVVFTGFELQNRPVTIGGPGSPLTRAIDETSEIRLDHRQAVFTLHFAALDFVAPGSNRYRYKLEGFDRDWTDVGTVPTASYAGLPAGDYVFRVMASNNDGVWSEEGRSLRIRIVPPIWQRWWFRLLAVAALAAAAVYGAISARRRHAQLRFIHGRLALAAQRDREAQEELERNVLEILDGMRRSRGAEPPLPLAVEGDVAISELRRGINRVLAERHAAEEELRQSQKMEAVGRLAGGVAHDFNNLLTVIKGNATLALEECADKPGVREELEEVSRAAERAGSLTGQLLALSRRQILQPRLLSLNSVVEDMKRLLRRTLGEGIELELLLDPALGLVRADPGQVEQIILNLVVNARDAMPGGGRLTVGTRRVSAEEGAQVRRGRADGKEYVALQVTDTGSGIRADVRDHIFEPFFTTKEAGEGTGLGLSTVHAIAQEHGGQVQVESEPGRGSTFTVYLPCAREGARPEPEHDTIPPGASPVPRATVLLVEDEDALRRLGSRVLERAGYHVLSAAGGAQALALADRHPGTINLLLTDVVMPGMSGRELAEQLLPRRPDIRLLYTSGYTEDAIVRHGVSGRGTDFLGKPFTPQQLLAKVQAVLEQPRPALAAGEAERARREA